MKKLIKHPLTGRPCSGRLHKNGGGFVAKTARVAETAYVGANAKVLDFARVDGRATDHGACDGSR